MTAPRCTDRLATKIGARCKVLRADDREFGLFTDEPIHHSQFVAQYTGEVIPMIEYRERYRSRYNGRQTTTAKRMVSGVLCLFICAKRDVEADEELTLDYEFDTFPGTESQPCLCGAESCRGFLGG
ncbi:Histone-lysine N-methyltransferase ASH1L [Beauveria bassiana]|uniref:Histone-lysine N-methyltransferase ASH1L n=1 Tax=Beauveria bassiana TaxID=176275 RepID=A0A2N6N907_BEABA|nr:Histone-lysine N-methyltransferase ASH1L [Beauveria bassiana]PMB63760.1 Histone-lysine N-methyltransferase ASH1L [Beauveria bassiana]